MTCREVESLLSLYLDGALTGAQMQQVAAHTEACTSCRAEFKQLQSTQRLLSTLGKQSAPPDLALRLRVALSQARAESFRQRWEIFWVRVENGFNAFMFPATAGVLSAVLFFGLIIGFFGLPVPARGGDGPDVPLGLYTPPQLAASPPLFLNTISSNNSNGNNDDPVLVETYVDANGRVQDYRIISAPEGSDNLVPELDNLLIFTTFRPAMSMGRPTAGRVVLSFSHMNVKG
jgi:hypothetical protein